MSAANDIVLAIRAAAAHEDAAGRAEDKYAQQMKAAGASMYQAFTLAVRAAPDYQGRKLDDKAILRLYSGTAPRPWWDAHLAAAKLTDGSGRADRDRAKRLIQWHVDPSGAEARRAQAVVRALASRKRLSAQRTSASRGETVRPKGAAAREAKHADRITEGNTRAALAGRELGQEAEPVHAAPMATREDLLGEVNRISSAVRKIKAGEFDAVLEILKVTAREVEAFT